MPNTHTRVERAIGANMDIMIQLDPTEQSNSITKNTTPPNGAMWADGDIMPNVCLRVDDCGGVDSGGELASGFFKQLKKRDHCVVSAGDSNHSE